MGSITLSSPHTLSVRHLAEKYFGRILGKPEYEVGVATMDVLAVAVMCCVFLLLLGGFTVPFFRKRAEIAVCRNVDCVRCSKYKQIAAQVSNIRPSPSHCRLWDELGP